MKTELLNQGKTLLTRIKIRRREADALHRIHALRLGITRLGADDLPDTAPEGVYFLINRFYPSGGDDPAPPDYAFVVTKPGITFEDAEELWQEVKDAVKPLRAELSALDRELREIDMQVRDYTGAEQRSDGSWVLRNRRGGILADQDSLGKPIRDEATLRRIAYARWQEAVFEASPFGLQPPELL